MIRLHVTAEGQTEEKFVNRLLAPHLSHYNVFTDVRCVLTSKDKHNQREYRGGFRKKNAYLTVRKDITAWLKEDKRRDCRFTTMFDLYALPDDFPGKKESNQVINPYEKVKTIEKAFFEDINDHRFLPYIQLHEFEALIFSDPEQLAKEYFDYDIAIKNLIKVLDDARGNPELIDDNPETAPSKRIKREIPEYDKTSAGILVVMHIGLDKIRDRCRHFNEWLEQMERMAGGNSAIISG